MKLISTRRDVSVWIIAVYMLTVNIVCWYLMGRELGLTVGNMFGLGTVAIFVLWSGQNKKVNHWLNQKVNW